MSEEEPTVESTRELEKAIEDEASRLYRDDRLIRHICDSVVSEALRSMEGSDAQVAHDTIRLAVMKAIAMVASPGSETNFVIRERNMYRDRILEMARNLPDIPIHPTTLVDKGIEGLATREVEE